MDSHSDIYKDAGVDVTAGYKAVELINSHIQRTLTPGVISSIGGFGAAFAPDLTGMKEPVLVSGTDGVGTKLKLAFLTDRHHTIGIDCVAMCVDDIVCCGARPLFFLDYIAMGKNIPEKVAQIVSGVAEGCVKSACALVGGETAEMPGFYAEDEYDIAGFAVGIVDRGCMIDGSTISDGDLIIGLASSGLHSNGYSLVRKVFDVENTDLNENIPELGCTLADELLRPTRIYCRTINALTGRCALHIKGMSHITGGGFYENIPRMLPDGLAFEIDTASWPADPMFDEVVALAELDQEESFSTFNMGIGMVLAVSPEQADAIIQAIQQTGQSVYRIGSVIVGSEGILT